MPRKQNRLIKKLELSKQEKSKKEFILKRSADLKNMIKIFRETCPMIKEMIKDANIDWFDKDEKKEIKEISNWIECVSKSNSDYLKPRLENDSTAWLDNLPVDLVGSFSILVEKISMWINPFRRGSTGMNNEIMTEVKDKDIEVLIESIKKCKEWKLNTSVKNMKCEPKAKDVVHMKWSTEREDVAKKFFDRFIIADTNTIFSKWYVKNDSLEDSNFIILKKEQIENMNSFYLNYTICKQLGWDPKNDVNFHSTKVIFGKFTRPGTITSACIQKINQTNKSRNSIGRFSIQYIKNVYPKNNIGLLSFSCKYFTYKNGRMDNN